jgi:glucosyl-3-phosphoglycerate synthase
MLGWKGWSDSRHAVFGTTVDDVLANAPCDIVVVRGAGRGRIRRILVPVRGGPNAVLAAHLAGIIAERQQARITALHVAPVTRSRTRYRPAEEFDAVLNTLPDQSLVRRIDVAADEVEEAILSQARQHQLIIMGAAAGGKPSAPVFGEITESVAAAFPGTVMIVKTRLPADLPHEQWLRLAPAVEPAAAPRLDLAARVDKWFAENTFDSDEFENIADLLRLKERQGITISLGLPALNEEETIGAILSAVKRELVDRYPLLDEMVVIDSQSQDRTREIARDLGIPVHIHQKTLVKEVGSRRGKGEALWKSLHVLRGDIVAWVDTDIRNFHPRFVYGVIGPLLRYPRIQYVKGFYKRPLRIGGTLQSTGGGRVTELTARPLINFFFPELSGLIQPLAGEFAGRRPLLEQIPFFTGYGVETGLLIDILDRAGLDAIGQVDLKRRVHRNQSLSALSGMAFTILQVVMRRLEERRRVQLLTELNTSMKLIQHDKDGFHVEVRALEDMERPPMRTIPAYWNYQNGIDAPSEQSRIS